MMKATIQNSPYCTEMQFLMYALPAVSDNSDDFDPCVKEFEKVRTLDINGEPWFVGKDICALFGDKNHKRSLGRIDDEDKKKAELIDSLNRKQIATVINESGLYSLPFNM